MLQKVNANKSSGPDNLSPIILKCFCNYLDPPITSLINRSLSEGVLLSECLKAKEVILMSVIIDQFLYCVLLVRLLRDAYIIVSPLAERGPVCIFRSPKFLLKFVQGTTPGVKKTWVDMLDHGSNSGKLFSKWPPEEKPICTYLLHQLANLDDQNVQYAIL